jgi:hypothetical protein
MASEHHIDDFDIESFFHLHDLNRDKFWDREQIEAIYGVHHVYSQKKSKDDEEHQKKADHISSTVLKLLDRNGDGRVSVEELKLAGLDGLPNFDDLGAEGHHYDVESEFFLHHEEMYHNTPETQTDESYNHPEDLEHFAHHEAIERKEAEKEAKYQGITVEEVLAAQEEALAHSGEHSQEPVGVDSNAPANPNTKPPPKITRVTPPEKQDPSVKYQAVRDRKAEWGEGTDGYKAPKEPVDRMRKNVPYKYKFRRNWGDF